MTARTWEALNNRVLVASLEIASLSHPLTIAMPVRKVVPNLDPVSEWRLIGPYSTAPWDPGTLVERVAELLRVSELGVN